MKKTIIIILTIVITISFSACSSNKDISNRLKKEGVSPYKLTDNETHLLQAFGMENKSQIISFLAPKEAISLSVHVYRLNNGVWDDIGKGAVSIGNEREPIDQLYGTASMILKENYAIDFNINCAGSASYKTEEFEVTTENKISMHSFLNSHKNIELNKEIPIALMVYDVSSVKSTYSFEDFFEPSKFKDIGLVQAVTLTFSDKEL